jgi:hypothetical protein
MNKRMLKKNLKKNRDKNRKKLKNSNEIRYRTGIINATADLQSLKDAELRIHKLAISEHSQIPVNAKVIKEEEGWMFYLSQDNQAIYLKTTDYHADPLRLTLENLNDIITLIKTAK